MEWKMDGGKRRVEALNAEFTCDPRKCDIRLVVGHREPESLDERCMLQITAENGVSDVGNDRLRRFGILIDGAYCLLKLHQKLQKKSLTTTLVK